MIPNKNIRVTLLKLLFIQPNPINRSDYQHAKEKIFPGINNFINFLKQEDHQLIVKCAKEILQRLTYNIDYPPASRLTNNLLAFEDKEKKQCVR